MSYTDTESDGDSLEFLNDFDGEKPLPDNEVVHVNNVRNAVKTWKQKEMDKNTLKENNASGLDSLRGYISRSSQLYYDLNNFMTTSKNNEKNMKDSLYVAIVSAIGNPASLGFNLRTLIDHYLQRDLVELPFTLEPNVINSHAEKGLLSQTDFPEEE